MFDLTFIAVCVTHLNQLVW